MGAVAEWSKALLLREKINENQKITGSPPGLGNLKTLEILYLKRYSRGLHSLSGPELQWSISMQPAS